MGFAEGQQVTTTLRLIRLLGQGGMGSVWSARHSGLDLDVAVKFIASELVEKDDPLVVERFKREAQLAARIDSPHVVRTFDHGMTSDGVPYIVMELLRGESLHERLQRKRRIDPREAARIVAEISRGLERAHALGIVHRDIKPHNVFLATAPDGGETVKLLDFGVAKARTNETQSLSTSSGVLIGTPQYMSPEQLMRAGPVEPSADLWALSVMTYEMVTGKLPFRGETLAATLVAITRADLEPPSSVDPRVPAALDAWFLRALAIDPDRRFTTAKELARALDAAVEGVAPLGPAPDAVAARTGTIEAPTLDEQSGTSEFLALRGMDVPASVRPAELALAATALDLKSPSSPKPRGSSDATLPSATAHDLPGIESSKAEPKIEPGPETRFRRRWTERRIALLAGGVLVAGLGGGLVISRVTARPPVPPPSPTHESPAPSATPSETASTPAPSSTVAPAPKLGKVERTDIPPGFVPLSRVWLPQFSIVRAPGDEDANVMDAESACEGKAMALCTESQWARACESHPEIASMPSWTSTTTEKGLVVRGGQPADDNAMGYGDGGTASCTTRKVVAGDSHEPGRIGVCCSRAVGVASSLDSAAFIQTTAHKLLEFESALNSFSGARTALLVDDPIDFYGRSMTRDEFANWVNWRSRSSGIFIHDACEVTFEKNETGDSKWSADCTCSSIGPDGVTRNLRRYVHGGPKGLMLEMHEPKPPLKIVEVPEKKKDDPKKP